jgi:hypothetical protein
MRRLCGRQKREPPVRLARSAQPDRHRRGAAMEGFFPFYGSSPRSPCSFRPVGPAVCAGYRAPPPITTGKSIASPVELVQELDTGSPPFFGRVGKDGLPGPSRDRCGVPYFATFAACRTRYDTRPDGVIWVAGGSLTRHQPRPSVSTLPKGGNRREKRPQ